jgi:AraC-like DNA-binding protein
VAEGDSVAKKGDPSQAEQSAPEFILPESSWLVAPPAAVDRRGIAAKVKLSKWSKAVMHDPIEFAADHEETAHVLSYSLRRLDYKFTLGGRTVLDSVINPNRVFLLPPVSARRTGVYRSPYNSVRIFLPPELISECYVSMYDRTMPSGVELFNAEFTQDSLVSDLARILGSVDENGVGIDSTFIDAVGLALTSRLISLSSARRPSSASATRPLAKWRLRRTIDYLEAHLRESISLEDLSAVAGLSRLRFAAQFRSAVGHAPYRYIVSRRIEEAQRLLLDPSWTIAGVANEMGFADQAHFTRAFKKVVGMTPARWRLAAME